MGDTVVNVSTAKTHFSRLLARVERGERIVITRAGRPVAELVQLAPRRPPRVPSHDEIVIHDSFDDPLPEFEEYT